MKRKRIALMLTIGLIILSVVSSNVVFALPTEKRNQYEKNANGETYGYAIQSETIGYEPDLIAATGTNGEDGYVRGTDLDGPVPSSPEEAIAMQSPNGRYIPLYESDGKTVIGEFYISPPATDLPMTRGTSTTGGIITIDVYGTTYRNQNSGSGDGARAYATTTIWADRTVSGGSMGAQARVYGAGDNKLKAQSDWVYNSGYSTSLTATTSHWTLYGTYYSKGSTREWTGTQYWQHATAQTPYFTV